MEQTETMNSVDQAILNFNEKEGRLPVTADEWRAVFFSALGLEVLREFGKVLEA